MRGRYGSGVLCDIWIGYLMRVLEFIVTINETGKKEHFTILTNASNTPSAHSHPTQTLTPKHQVRTTNPACRTPNSRVHPPPLDPSAKCAMNGRRREEVSGRRRRMGRRMEREKRNSRKVGGRERVARIGGVMKVKSRGAVREGDFCVGACVRLLVSLHYGEEG
jgi:hypothetical protein